MLRLALVGMFAVGVAVFSGCGSKQSQPGQQNQNVVIPVVKQYTCPMHSEMLSTNSEDKCQRCGMALVEKK